MHLHHHLHLRKRVSKELEPFPARTTQLRLLDVVVYIVGILGPLATIPQLFEIYTTENAAGVSALSWGLLALFNIPWILYGIAHREWPIVVTYILWLFFNALVFAGAVVYG